MAGAKLAELFCWADSKAAENVVLIGALCSIRLVASCTRRLEKRTKVSEFGHSGLQTGKWDQTICVKTISHNRDAALAGQVRARKALFDLAAFYWWFYWWFEQ